MAATTARPTGRLLLKTAAFDQLTRITFGQVSNEEVAERLGMNSSNLSALRGRRNSVSGTFIARFIEQWPHLNIKDFVDAEDVAS